MENAISKFLIWGGGKFGVENAISDLEFGWMEDLGWKMLSRISNLGGGKFGEENSISKFPYWGGGKFGMENAISNLEFGGWKIWGGKCYLESSIFGVENLGCKKLSRISNLRGGKFRVENAISKFIIWGGGKFGVENAVSNLEFGGWKIWGGKFYLEISILGGGVENLGWKMLSPISNLGGGKFGAENAISNLQFLGWKIWGVKCCLESRIWGVENLGWKMLSRNL